MPAGSAPKRNVALVLLWTVVLLMGWLMAVQLALIAFAHQGEWQWPDVYQAEVVEVFKDTSNAFTRDVYVTIDGELETITLPKPDAARLQPHDTIRVLDNFYATPLRPAQFILTPGRVLGEYPEILLLLALLAIQLLRRSKWGLIPDPPPVPEADKKVFRDTFHQRAQRHGENPSTKGPDALE
ncbi:hypothetical protein [Geothrix sp. 21YS21S-2]|uniref:hypothetical protein n=1 Tax=Geothrix sp. 21YS21S-2 TaxID=3068893 RepID=UPI0027BA9E9E|nr:hypothetical protein [Geothrix sp. 21YS21S-2]